MLIIIIGYCITALISFLLGMRLQNRLHREELNKLIRESEMLHNEFYTFVENVWKIMEK